jgi:uncharacterized repeat protein (TIGR01451 family)
VTNAGPSIANQVSLTDTLPVSVTLQTMETSQGTCGGTTCDLEIMGYGESVYLTMTVAVPPDATETLTNTAEVNSLEADEDLEDNTEITETEVISVSDLEVTKTGDPEVVIAGHPISYTLVVTNTGPSEAVNVVISDTLPAGVTILWASSLDCTIHPTSVICQIDRLLVEESLQITLTGEVSPSTLGPTIINQVEVSSDASDLDGSNNVDTASTAVQTQADLSVVQSDDPDPVHAQEYLTYTITITNAGPSDAWNLTLEDTLDPGVTFVSSVPSQPGCSYLSPVVHCELGVLGVDQSMTITITTLTGKYTVGDITNHVSVSSDADDLYPDDNESEETTYLPPDNTPPSVTWTAPTTDDETYYVRGEVVTLAAAASDDVAIDYVRFYRWDWVDGVYRDIGILHSPPYQVDFNTYLLGTGFNEVRVIAYDTAGNHSEETGLVFIWLYYLPTVRLPVIMR